MANYFKRALDNASRRMSNAQNSGANWKVQLGAAFSPNRTSAGNSWYNNIIPKAQASETSNPNIQGGQSIYKNGYYNIPKVNDDGTLGMDYFKGNGIPVTNTEFAQATGVDTNALESGSSESLSRGNNQLQYNPPANTGTSNSTANVYTPKIVYGEWSYSPEQETEIVNRQIEKIYQQNVAKIEQSFKRGFLTIDQRDDEIKKTRTALIKKKDSDLQSVSGYFNSISPDAIQSGRGKLETQAVEDYTNQNKSLGSELTGIYDQYGKVRQDLTPDQLAPYINENSDTGNLARAIAENYSGYKSGLQSASENKNSMLETNANDYISNKGIAGGNYTNYLNSNVLNNRTQNASTASPAIVKKTDKYGNPIDEWYNQ